MLPIIPSCTFDSSVERICKAARYAPPYKFKAFINNKKP